MAGGEDQPQQFIADVIVERSIEIGHDPLLLQHIARQHVVLVRQHLAAAQDIERTPPCGRHEPGAGIVGHADDRPGFQRRNQRVLGQLFRKRHVAQHPRQHRDQPRLHDAPGGVNRGTDDLIDVGGRHRRRP